jgi:glycosyltransferase involved in cell wall biosynthesis
MTAYNREKYIAEAIESVLASTYTNFELIIVDDRSTDNTYHIAKAYELKDPRVRVYLNSKNLGDYPNRNKAAGYAKGKYLKYVDCDDKIFPSCLEVMVNAIEKYPEAALGICKSTGSSVELLASEQAYLSPIGILEYYGPTGSIIVSKRFFELGMFKELVTVSDWDMWYRLAARWPVVAMPADLVLWRDHANNTLKSDSHKIGVFKNYLKLKVQILTSEYCPVSKDEAKKLLKKYSWDILKMNLKLSVKRFTLKFFGIYLKNNWRYLKYL